MRVAVLYSGQLRTWSQCRQNQVERFYTPETDTYFYTYEKPEQYTQFIQIPQDYYTEIIHTYDSNSNDITKDYGVHKSLLQWHHQFVNFCTVPTGYDVYIKSRTDIVVSDKIDFSQYNINSPNIYIPSGHDHCGGVNDQFAFGSYETMKKYFSVYLEHKNLFDNGLCFHTELYLTENLKAKGVNIVRIGQTTEIVR